MNVKESLELAEFYDSQIDAHHDLGEIRTLRRERRLQLDQKIAPRDIDQDIWYPGHVQLRGSIYPPTVVTHVCRTWRNTASNEPTLWTDFTNVHPKWVRGNFARSKAASGPLRLRYGYDDSPSDALAFVVDALVESPEQIRELHVVDYDRSFIDQLTQPIPFLESLAVELGAPVTFPPSFLGGVAPRLRSVRCTGPCLWKRAGLQMCAVWITTDRWILEHIC